MNRFLTARTALLSTILLFAAPSSAEQQDGTVPVPVERPAFEAPVSADSPEKNVDQDTPQMAVPVPKSRSDAAAEESVERPSATEDSSDQPNSTNDRNTVRAVFKPPVPKWRPEPAKDGDVAQQSSELDGLPVKEAACRNRLTAMGVRFAPADRIDGEGGCGIGHPIRVTWLPQQVKLSGRAIMGCEEAALFRYPSNLDNGSF